VNTVVTFNNKIDSLFDRKIESVTRGLRPDANRYLQSISLPNALVIIDYITSMRTEINLSDNYRRDLIILLCRFSRTNHHKPFEQITRQDVISFLDSFRKAEDIDSLHKWIGTYNLYRTHVLCYFKWLYYPGIQANKRPKPGVIKNIPKLRRKEQSIYKPTDLWTQETGFNVLLKEMLAEKTHHLM